MHYSFIRNLLLFFFDLYSFEKKRIADDAVSIILSTIASLVLYLIISIFVTSLKTEFKSIIAFFGVTMLMLLVWRLFVDVIYFYKLNSKHVLIVESKQIPSRLARKLKYSFQNPENVQYYIIDESDSDSVDYLISEIVLKYDNIILSSGLSVPVHDRLFSYCLSHDKKVSSFANLQNFSLLNGFTRMHMDTPVIEVNPIGISHIEQFLKRAFDIVLSSILLVLFSPFFAVCAILIKIDSTGPAFYKQERYTLNKKTFYCLKFRTMRVDAEANGAQLSTKNDTRLTRMGKIIRKTRLDELPQLVNVFKGEMSFVGPRPERPIFADEFCKKVKNYELRYLLKAGITGYAQVYGNYNSRASDKILLDLIYAMDYSLLLDIKLILMTVRQIFIHDSSEGDDEAFEAEMNTLERELERRKNFIRETKND